MYDSTKPYKSQILELIRQTWKTPYVSVENGIIKKKFSYPEYHHTDGIGTKGVYHWRNKSFENAVIDALAMNLNDLVLMRARPYALIDHLFLPEDDYDAILEILSYLTDECKKRKIAITGGETAIHDNMEGLEISITMPGFIKNPRPNKLKKGNVLIGIESNGLHSNGFTKVRELFNEYREEFTKPTNIYSDIISSLDEKICIDGMMHITGGAFSKLKDVLPYDADAIITDQHRLEPQEIFFDIYNKGVSDEEMYKTFNCGIGFVLGIDEEYAEGVLKEIKNFKTDVIGKVTDGNNKIKIKSKFSDKEIEI